MLSKFFAITWRTLKNRKVSLSVYIVVFIGMVELFAVIYPTFDFEALTEAYSQLGGSFEAALGVSELNFSTYEGWLSLELFSFIFPLILIIILLGLAGSSLAGAIEKGTIELVLSRPVSRLTYFFSKYFTGLVVMTFFSAIAAYAPILFGNLHNIEVATQNYTTMFLASLLFGWGILSLGFLASSFFMDKSRALFVTGGVLFLMYIANVVASLSETFEFLRHGSFFNYFNADILVTNTIGNNTIIFFGVFAIVATVIGAWRWQKRDIAV